MRTRTAVLDIGAGAALTRRGFLLLLGAAAAWTWSARLAFGQTELDAYGRPIRLPGETPTPETRAREREAVEQSRDRVIDNRTQDRALQSQQHFQNDRAAAQQRDVQVQQNFQQQQQDILNSRDKP